MSVSVITEADWDRLRRVIREELAIISSPERTQNDDGIDALFPFKDWGDK